MKKILPEDFNIPQFEKFIDGLKKVVVLAGAPLIGKSECLKKVLRFLAQKAEFKYLAVAGKGRQTRCHYPTNQINLDDGLDYIAVFKYGTKNIAIVTRGDNGSVMRDDFGVIAKFKCDILFCASRSGINSTHAENDFSSGWHTISTIRFLQEMARKRLVSGNPLEMIPYYKILNPSLYNDNDLRANYENNMQIAKHLIALAGIGGI